MKSAISQDAHINFSSLSAFRLPEMIEHELVSLALTH